MECLEELLQKQAKQQQRIESLLQTQADKGLSDSVTEMLRTATIELTELNYQVQKAKDDEVLEQIAAQCD
jgi:hypothetical protein